MTTTKESQKIDITDNDINEISLDSTISTLSTILAKLKESTDLSEFNSLAEEEKKHLSLLQSQNIPKYLYAKEVINSQSKLQRYVVNEYISMLDESIKPITAALFDNIFSNGNSLSKVLDALDSVIEKEKKKDQSQIVKTEQREIDLMQNKLERLETENKIMTEKLIKNAKDIVSSNQKPKAKNESNYTSNNISGNIITGTTAKVLTIKMTKDIINEIYASKVQYDKKCIENKLPRETMEQHMYTYLNNKYGLKKLIIEWASSIINAIKLYSKEDSDIKLFGFIMRNEQEEESRFILSKLRSTISDLLEYYIKSKNPFKSANEIKKMLKKKKEGILDEEEWKGIIYYIYTNDGELIENKIIEFITRNNSRNNSSTSLSSKKRLTREQIFNMSKVKNEMTIAYEDFIKVVSEYQIMSRAKYLSNFVDLFKSVDSDNDGVIDEKEFNELLNNLPIEKENINDYSLKLLEILDPFNNNKITFSECVSLFSMEMIDDVDSTKKSILDKICMKQEQ